MNERVATKPTLFTVPPAPGSETRLLGARCSGGHLFFPPQQMGCDICGAHGSDIAIVELAALGVLKTFARAYRQQRPGSAAPLVIGTVLLDAGPAVEVILDVDDTDALRCGQRVAGHLVEVGEDEAGRQLVDCFFAPEEVAG